MTNYDPSLDNSPITRVISTNSDGSPNYSSSSGGGVTATQRYGQQTSNTSAVQLQSSSQTLTNGVIIQALSTNSASVFIGDASVTAATGFELQPGQATSLVVSNMNIPYVIGSNSSDKVCWLGS